MRPAAATVPESYDLSWHESLRLLTGAHVGRIVYSDHALPAVQPVNFVVDDEAVIFRAAEGSRLARAVENAVVAFEADEYDPDAGTGWSVAVVGKCEAVSEPREVSRLSGLVPLHWAPVGEGRFVRICIAELSGRRIGPHE
ncbi:MAG: pyridoxamine 5'-phosphate oxidase family protein [Micromonosporaceae bacterium]